MADKLNQSKYEKINPDLYVTKDSAIKSEIASDHVFEKSVPVFGKGQKLKDAFSYIDHLEQELENYKNDTNLLKIKSFDQIIAEKTKEIDSLDEKINIRKESLLDSENQLLEVKNQIELERENLVTLEDRIVMESFGLYKPRYDFANSNGYKEKLTSVRETQKSMIRTQQAVYVAKEWTVDGNKAKGRKMTSEAIKLMLRAFNTECEAAINKVKASNIESIEKRIQKSYEAINKLNNMNELTITRNYLNEKLNELYLAYEYELAKEAERELLREQREKEREEKALLAEVSSKKKVIAKEVVRLNTLIAQLEKKLKEATEENTHSIQEKISDALREINSLEDQQKDLDYRIEHANAGYVYIISNIGSFGENVYKIGVTRRLEPLERVRELSDASVPFTFNVHALIFSYEAYALESELHALFADKRLNLINNRKEFFRLEFSEIEAALEKHKDLSFEVTQYPDAEEYFQSEKMRELSVANI